MRRRTLLLLSAVVWLAYAADARAHFLFVRIGPRIDVPDRHERMLEPGLARKLFVDPHIVMTENRFPSTAASRNDAWPGPTTGMDRRERNAETPESLIELIQTAAYPSVSARAPMSRQKASARVAS